MSNGVYIHIPFCASKCGYCGFYSCVRSDKFITEYAGALISQIRAEKFERSVASVYFGGGTPSLLSCDSINRIMTALSATAIIEKDAEITMEVNPESVDREYVKRITGCGINRVSMGIQSLNNAELAALGRRATAEKCITAYGDIVSGGIENISVDIMLAIPHQTDESLISTLDGIARLNPPHISAYLLKIEENSVFGKRGMTEESDEIQERRYILCDDYLTRLGYEHYEISSFAKNGMRSRHNMLYWTGGTYHAFGSGASGFDGKKRYRYHENASRFVACGGIVDAEEEDTVTESSVLDERIIFGLRTADGISSEYLNEKQTAYFESLISTGLCEKTPCGYRLTRRGYLVSDRIILEALTVS